MKFTKEELHEMRKLAGIENAAVDFRRPQDYLAEDIADQTHPVEECNCGKLPDHKMPGKSIAKKTFKSSGSTTTLQALLAKHKEAARAGKPGEHVSVAEWRTPERKDQE